MSKPIFTVSSSRHIEVFGSGSTLSAEGNSVSSVKRSSSFSPQQTSGYISGPTQTLEGWNSLSAKRTTSFSSIHKEVSQSISYSPVQAYSVALAEEGDGTSSGRPGMPDPSIDTPPTGQLVPVGDMLIPMLIIALSYVFVKLFRNRKTSQAL